MSIELVMPSNHLLSVVNWALCTVRRIAMCHQARDCLGKWADLLCGPQAWQPLFPRKQRPIQILQHIHVCFSVVVKFLTSTCATGGASGFAQFSYQYSYWLIGKDPDVGKDWRQKKRVTEDEMVEWHYWFNGHELGQTLRDGEGEGGLECCSPCCREELDMTWWLNNNITLLGK